MLDQPAPTAGYITLQPALVELAEVEGVVDRREAYFRAQGIDSIETYRLRRARAEDQGRADDGYGDVFLVVDGWSTLRSDFDDVEVASDSRCPEDVTCVWAGDAERRNPPRRTMSSSCSSSRRVTPSPPGSSLRCRVRE